MNAEHDKKNSDESENTEHKGPEHTSEPMDQSHNFLNDDDQDGPGERIADFTKKAAFATEQFVGSSYKKAKKVLETSNPRACVRIIDGIIAWIRELFPPEKYETLVSHLGRFGHISLVLTQGLTLLLSLIASIKYSSPVLFLAGICGAALLVILQYTADKFLTAGDRLIKSSPSCVATSSMLDCTAVLVELAGFIAFVSVVVMAKRMEQWNLLFVGLGIWALCDAVAYIAINPSMVNITVSEHVSAGEEAIGVLSFFAKTVVRIVPIAFGIGTLIGAAGVLIGTLGLLFSSADSLRGGLLPGLAPLKLVVFCACLPFGSYLLFTVYNLFIDILRSVLILPKKIDNLTKKDI